MVGRRREKEKEEEEEKVEDEKERAVELLVGQKQLGT